MHHGSGHHIFAIYALFFVFFFQQDKSCLNISLNHLIYTKLSYQEITKTIFAETHLKNVIQITLKKLDNWIEKCQFVNNNKILLNYLKNLSLGGKAWVSTVENQITAHRTRKQIS